MIPFEDTIDVMEAIAQHEANLAAENDSDDQEAA